VPRRRNGSSCSESAKETEAGTLSTANCRHAAGAVLFLTAGWLNSPSNAQAPADLLAIPVRGSEPRAYTEFNQIVAAARAAGDDWPQDPVMVTRRFTGWRAERAGVWVIQGSGERPTHYKIIAIVDGFPNDSVRGERLEVVLERGGDGSWRITDAFISWRCWPGRGNQSFGTEKCA
jgi:hypothetical protein